MILRCAAYARYSSDLQSPRSIEDQLRICREYANAHGFSDFPKAIKAGLDPQQIAKMLGESLRQHFLQSGVPETVKALQATSAAMTSAQRELPTALRGLSDSQGGVVAQVERANNRLEYSLESRAKTFDALLHEWKSDLLRIWIPLIGGAAMLIGLFGGMEIQGCRDVAPSASAAPPQTIAPPVAGQVPQTSDASGANPKPQRTREKARAETAHER